MQIWTTSIIVNKTTNIVLRIYYGLHTQTGAMRTTLKCIEFNVLQFNASKTRLLAVVVDVVSLISAYIIGHRTHNHGRRSIRSY